MMGIGMRKQRRGVDAGDQAAETRGVETRKETVTRLRLADIGPSYRPLHHPTRLGRVRRSRIGKLTAEL